MTPPPAKVDTPTPMQEFQAAIKLVNHLQKELRLPWFICYDCDLLFSGTRGNELECDDEGTIASYCNGCTAHCNACDEDYACDMGHTHYDCPGNSELLYNRDENDQYKVDTDNKE